MTNGKQGGKSGGGKATSGDDGVAKGEAGKKAPDPSAEDAKILGETKPRTVFKATPNISESGASGAKGEAPKDGARKADAEKAAATAPAPKADAPKADAAKSETAAGKSVGGASASAKASASKDDKPKDDDASKDGGVKSAASAAASSAAAAKSASGTGDIGAAPRAAEAAREKPARSGGGLGALLYAVVGGLIGGFGVYYATGLTGQSAAPAADALTLASVTEIVEREVAEASAGLTAASEARADALAGQIANLEAGDGAEGVEALEAEVAGLRDALATERTRISRLNDELAQRERQRTAAVSAIREQVASLAAAIAATPGATLAAEGGASAGGAADSTRLALLEGGLRQIEARVNGLSAGALPTPDLTRIDKLEDADRTFGDSLAALDARVKDVEADARSAVTDQAATGIAYAALAEAVAGSAPYAAPLATLREVAGLEQAYPALTESAEIGLPSDVTLAARFDEAARRALDAAAKDRAARGEAGVADRLSGLFTIRRVVEPGAEGESEEAVLARAEARIDEGDVHASLLELETLPQAARAAMGDWIEAAERRAAAETAMAALRAQLLGVEP